MMNHAREKKGIILIISGPSGVGKTTIARLLLEKAPAYFHLERAITYTSRTPRKGEIDGIDYHFISSQEFEAKISQGFFIEWSGAYGAYYGSPRSLLDRVDAGASVLLILDHEGGRQIFEQTPRAIGIWLYADMEKVVRGRLTGRRTETQQQIDARIAQSLKELAFENQKRVFKYHVENNSLEKTLDEILSILAKEIANQR